MTAVQHEIHRARAILADLDKAADLGIGTPQLETLCAIADFVSAAGKPSGAGGDYYGIAICEKDQTAKLARRWIEQGLGDRQARQAERRARDQRRAKAPAGLDAGGRFCAVAPPASPGRATYAGTPRLRLPQALVRSKHLDKN